MLKNVSWEIKTLAIVFLSILALLPFHALISTWLISNFGFETLIKSWKELLLLVVVLPLCTLIFWRNPTLLRTIAKRKVNRLIFWFMLLAVVLALLTDNGGKSTIAALVFNLRFFAMFLVAQLLVLTLIPQMLKAVAFKIVIIGGLVVVVFGALQVLLLPDDFLRHFGYRAGLIKPYFTVDNNESYVRILSTLRGPNVLGAYLVVWLPLLAVVTKQLWNKTRNERLWLGLVWFASIVTVFGSRSRSAWIGLVAALAVFYWIGHGKKRQKELLYAAFAVCAGIIVALALTWNRNFVQTTLLHRDPNEYSSVDSDDQRATSLKNSVERIVNNPLGHGPGSVGLASTYGDNWRIVENYYLQVAEEFGVIGLALFLSIVVAVGLQLWRIRHDDIAAALFAGLVGLSIVNLFLPAWGDETVSMIWWGMAGLVIFSVTKPTSKEVRVKS